MIRVLARASLVLWVQLFNTGLQLNLYWYEHNSPLARLTLWDQTVTEKARPSSCQSTKRHLFSTESHRNTVYHPVRAWCPRAGSGEKQGDRERQKDEGSRTDKMVSGESRSPQEHKKSFSCYVHRAKMAANGVRRGTRRRQARFREEDHDEGQRRKREELEEKDYS